jgi:cation:H+ antiporter
MSDLMIGLTVVAIGTSLPELATAMVAVRKGEHDLALGNVMGSNLFNTLAVVGLAAVIQPIAVEPEVLTRDVAVMGGLTVSLFVLGYGFRGPGRINRWEGLGLLSVYVAYLGFLIAGV